MKTDENQVQEIIVPLGKALKDARLAASLSLDEVAEKLNLSLSTVRDLEENLDAILETKRYPVIYLRGYLANYAKLLGLSTLELFVEYKQLDMIQKQSKSLRAPSLIIPPSKKCSNILPLLLLFFVVIVAVIYTFQKQLLTSFEQMGSLASPLISAPLTLTEHRPLPISDIISAEVTELSKDESVVERDVDTHTKMVVAVQTETDNEVLVKVVEDSSKKTLAPSQEGANEDQDVNVLADIAKNKHNIDLTSIINVETNTTTVEQDSVDNSISESLIISFSGECWTEIFDAKGKRIAFGLYDSGRVLQLTGVAPFQLKLGDPSVTEIQYKDQIIEGDFAPGRTAQFSVPLS